MKILVLLILNWFWLFGAGSFVVATGVSNGNLKTSLSGDTSNKQDVDTSFKGNFIELGYGQVVSSAMIRNFKYTVFYDEMMPKQNYTATKLLGIGINVEMDLRVNYIAPFISFNVGKYKLNNSHISSLSSQDFDSTTYGVNVGMLYAFAKNAELGLYYQLKYFNWGSVTIDNEQYTYKDTLNNLIFSLNIFF
jgi:long-subunit fatty acid transport protein